MTATPGPAPRKPWFLRAVPNTLSVLRLGFAVALPWLDFPMRGVAVALAGVTDGVDGYLARRWNATSFLGGLLDGIADKALVITAAVTFTLDGPLSIIHLPLLLSRDLTVAVLAVIVALRRRWSSFRMMKPRFPGKAATALLYLTLLVVGLVGEMGAAINALVAITAGVCLLAAGDYLLVFLHAWWTGRREARQVA